MRNAYTVLGVKPEIPTCEEANITANIVQETGNICSGYIHLAEERKCVWSLSTRYYF